MLKELENHGILNDTLVIYTSDNGIPFAGGRTNLYDSGIEVQVLQENYYNMCNFYILHYYCDVEGIKLPMLMSSPNPSHRHFDVTYAMSSHLDLVPTVLDWFSVPYPTTDLGTNHPVQPLHGKSLIPLLTKGSYIV